MPSTSSSRCVPAALLIAAALALSTAAAAASSQAGAPGSHPAGAAHPAGTAGRGSATGAASGAAGTGANGGKSANAGGGAAPAGTGEGEKLLQSASPPCTTCHQVKAGVNQPGPSLAGIAARAKQRIAARDYKGKARDAKAYIRESIMDPNAYVVPGQGYAVNGQSLMPKTYAQALKPEQIDQVVTYLMSLK